MRLTDTDIVKEDSHTYYIYDTFYDTFFQREKINHVFRVGFYNIMTSELKFFVVLFDERKPSIVLKFYLEVHARQTWDVMARRAKATISMYGYWEIDSDDWHVTSLLVTDNVGEYINKEDITKNL